MTTSFTLKHGPGGQVVFLQVVPERGVGLDAKCRKSALRTRPRQRAAALFDHLVGFSKFSPEVAGDISGPVSYQGKTVQRTWRVQGFAREPELVLNILAIASPEDPKPPTGIGTYYLARTGGGDFTGTAIYLDCVHKFVQCPYALASEDMSPEKARARWPELFKRACEKIDLTPGYQMALTC